MLCLSNQIKAINNDPPDGTFSDDSLVYVKVPGCKSTEMRVVPGIHLEIPALEAYLDSERKEYY